MKGPKSENGTRVRLQNGISLYSLKLVNELTYIKFITFKLNVFVLWCIDLVKLGPLGLAGAGASAPTTSTHTGTPSWVPETLPVQES